MAPGMGALAHSACSSVAGCTTSAWPLSCCILQLLLPQSSRLRLEKLPLDDDEPSSESSESSDLSESSCSWYGRASRNPAGASSTRCLTIMTERQASPCLSHGGCSATAHVGSRMLSSLVYDCRVQLRGTLRTVRCCARRTPLAVPRWAGHRPVATRTSRP
jgi:hypothetical protein